MWLTLNEADHHMGRRSGTARQMVERGFLQAYYVPGSDVRLLVSTEDIDAAIRQRPYKPARPIVR